MSKIKCGCLGCGRQFKAAKSGRKALEPVIEHMKTCCPEKYLANKDNKLLEKCQLGCKNCQVPGELERKARERERERVEKANAGKYLSEFFALRADYTPVDFLRPDGDIEGKDVQWCLDNDFFQIHEGYDGDYPLWSGPWYYRDRPEERPMHQQRIQKMEAIRSRNRNLHRFSRHFDR